MKNVERYLSVGVDVCINDVAALTRLGSVKPSVRTGTLDGRQFSHPNGSVDGGDLISSSVQGLKKVSLYVLGEKAQMKVRQAGWRYT